MRQVTLTLDHILMVTKKGSGQQRAGLDVMRLHRGVLNYQNAIDLRDRWTANGCPTMFIELKKLVSRLFTFGLIDVNPVAGISNPHMNHRRRPEIKREHWLALLEASKDEYIHPLILGLYMTGLSFIDICLLQWREVDVDAGVIRRVRKKMATRSGKECIIPLDPDGHYLAWLRNAAEFKDSTLGVYPSVNGNHYVAPELAIRVLRGEKRQSVIYAVWKRVRKKAGLEWIQIHDFRAHTCTALVNHMDPLLACQITGHTNLSMLQRYIVPNEKNIITRMAGVFDSQKKQEVSA